MSLKPCNRTACPELIKRGNRFCESHEAEDLARRQKLHDQRRGSSSKRGYNSRWRKFRQGFIAKWLRYNILCNHCFTPFRDTAQIHVDHIQPLAQGGAKYDEENLQFLCPSCHTKKTILENKGEKINKKK